MLLNFFLIIINEIKSNIFIICDTHKSIKKYRISDLIFEMLNLSLGEQHSSKENELVMVKIPDISNLFFLILVVLVLDDEGENTSKRS